MRLALVSSLLVAAVAAAVPAMAADGTPTFTKDVAPIFYKSCIECHRATMFAPMSLTSYEDARPWLRSIKQRVTERTMPPWGSDMPHGLFRNDPRLTDQEIQTIVSWIDGGAPKGDMADMPKMPALADGWTIGKPDAVYSMTEDFKIPAAGTIEYPVHPDSDEPAGGPLVHRGRDQAQRARTRPPRDRVHGTLQRQADAPRQHLRADEHHRRVAEQAGPRLRAWRREAPARRP